MPANVQVGCPHPHSASRLQQRRPWTNGCSSRRRHGCICCPGLQLRRPAVAVRPCQRVLQVEPSLLLEVVFSTARPPALGHADERIAEATAGQSWNVPGVVGRSLDVELKLRDRKKEEREHQSAGEIKSVAARVRAQGGGAVVRRVGCRGGRVALHLVVAVDP